MEASGHELGIGDAAEIRRKRVRKQKTDRQDAQLLLRLMVEDRFPRIWENRDLRQLLWHRHRLLQIRTRVFRFNEGRFRPYLNGARSQGDRFIPRAICCFGPDFAAIVLSVACCTYA
jgi:transposase